MNNEREYVQVCETVRHYSNLRFLMMPVFISITAMLMLVLFHKDYNPSYLIRLVVLAVGFITALIFLALDRLLDGYITNFIGRAKEIREDTFWGYRPRGRNVGPAAVETFYGLFGLVWCVLIALEGAGIQAA